jgi:hypothetical protein
LFRRKIYFWDGLQMRFTKLDGSPGEAFFVQAVISFLKVEEGEGGGGSSPLS